jgi:hypothetical protein|tara:strand:- start:2071 stop:2718 length:648 start_codon:yes stop_codon:yes gene_type:complete
MKSIDYNYFNWGPFLFKSIITKEFQKLILEEGASVRGQESESYNSKLAGHLNEQYKLPAARIMEHLKWYLEAYCIGYNKWRGNGGMKPNAKLLSLWINYMKAGDFNPPHDHSADLSFVCFPKIPPKLIEENKKHKGTLQGPGGISFMWGDSVNHMAISLVHQMPEENDIYIFPAGLKHWVFPFRSKVERISVSGNIMFEQDSRLSYFEGPKEKKE